VFQRPWGNTLHDLNMTHMLERTRYIKCWTSPCAQEASLANVIPGHAHPSARDAAWAGLIKVLQAPCLRTGISQIGRRLHEDEPVRHFTRQSGLPRSIITLPHLRSLSCAAAFMSLVAASIAHPGSAMTATPACSPVLQTIDPQNHETHHFSRITRVIHSYVVSACMYRSRFRKDRDGALR
jgi:hypothetical protein